MPSSLQFGGKGSAPGQFGSEIYLDVDATGRIFVSDTVNRRIQIFDSDGTLLHLIASVSEATSSEKPVLREAEGEVLRFEEPRAIAVAPNGHFFIADWQPISADVMKDQQLYLYTPIVHQFDSDRKYLGFVAMDSADFASKQIWNRQGVRCLTPVVDRSGRSAYALEGDYRRPLHLATGPDGDFYVLDEHRNKITRYDRSGIRQQTFGQFGQMDRATSISVDDLGNVYVADRGNDRVVRFDPGGEMTTVIGRRGRGDGELISPYLVRWVHGARRSRSGPDPQPPSHGLILVKDESVFSKVFQSYLERRKDDPQPPVWMEEDTDRVEDREKPGYKRYRRWLERVQAFDPGGAFRSKIVLRCEEREREDNRKLIAFDRGGALYFFDQEDHRIVVFIPEAAFRWNRVQKTYRLQIRKELEKSRVDASQDLDLDPDYIADLDFRLISQSLLLKYDLTERLGLSWEGRTLLLGGYRSYLFPGEQLPTDLPEDRSRYVHDYFVVDDVVRGDMKIGLEVVLNPDPYDYRQIKGFLELGGITYDFRYGTLSVENKAHANQDLWGWNVGVGTDWDIRKDLSGFVHVRYDSPESFMNYRYWYWDEEGDLIVASSTWGRKWTVSAGMYAVF